MTVACQIAEIRAEVCSDIFTAIEKGKTRAFSCVIVDWADQPEASFLLRRARESAPNRETVAVAIVDNEPTAAEMNDNRLDFLIYRPISAEEADVVLAKASLQMKPLTADALAETSVADDANGAGASTASDGAEHFHKITDLNVFERTHGILDILTRFLGGVTGCQLIELRIYLLPGEWSSRGPSII